MILDKWLLFFVAVGFGIARFLVPVEGAIAAEDIFKDMAHLVVGFMFGYAAYARNRKELWAIAVSLTMVEVAAFVLRKGT